MQLFLVKDILGATGLKTLVVCGAKLELVTYLPVC